MKHVGFTRYAWGTLAFNLAVIAWGAYVRASGSGAGCGAHWPLCNGEVLPRSPQAKTLVEFAHRTTSGLALLLVLGLAVWAFRRFSKGHPARAWAAGSLAFIMLEALIGAGLVLFEYVADNASTGRAIWMGVHLVNTFLLLASLVLTAWRAGDESELRWKGRGALGGILLTALAGTVLLAVSGAVAALGDTIFPAESLAQGLAQDLSPTAHALVRLRLLHPVIALVVGAFLLFTASYTTRGAQPAHVRRSAGALAGFVMLQLLAGSLNVALLAPVWLQLLHLLLADLVWLALVLLAAGALSAHAPAAETFEPREVAPA